MGGWGWAELIALVTSIGLGTISAVVPIVNAEAYVIASQVSAAAGPIPVAIGVAVGQTVGKVLLFLGVRRGREFPFVKHRRQKLQSRPVGPARARIRRWLATLLSLVGQKRWGLPIVLVSAVVGVPPLYAVALLAGATKMRLIWFALTVFVGRGTRFVLVAMGFRGIHPWFP